MSSTASEPPASHQERASAQEPASVREPASARHRLGLGAVVVVMLLALAVTVGIGIFRGQSAPTEAVTIERTPAATAAAAEPAEVYVHVSGAVRDPGLYVLPGGSRLVDAVAAAGGFTKHAARNGVNLARPLGDGEQIIVPREGEEPQTQPSQGAAVGGKVNLNTADQAALEELPGIGPALAQRILQWREDNGRFTSVDDLLAVSGIGDKVLAALRDLVTV